MTTLMHGYKMAFQLERQQGLITNMSQFET